MSPDKMEDISTLSKVGSTFADGGLMMYDYTRKQHSFRDKSPSSQKTPQLNIKIQKIYPQRKSCCSTGRQCTKVLLLCQTEGTHSLSTNQGNMAKIKFWTGFCNVVWNPHYHLGNTAHKGKFPKLLYAWDVISAVSYVLFFPIPYTHTKRSMTKL